MSKSLENQLKLHRWVVWFWARKIAKQLRLSNYVIGGSYRRGKWWCNDIDLLIPVRSPEEAEGMRERLKQLGWKKRTTFFNDSTFGHLLYKKIGDKLLCLDVFFVYPGCMGNALLFTTGSKEFNDTLRANVISMGYSWAHPPHFERIIDSTNLCFDSEKAAFDFLNMEYIVPKHRL